jgi:nucleotide-binding universal stress UspA family protein
MVQPPGRGIVVGVDGSAAALGAVRWAAADAALRNVPLTLVHVVDAALPEWLEAAAAAQKISGFRRSDHPAHTSST